MNSVIKAMEQRVKEYILEQDMICPGDTVIAGVSGGADSLCLFLLLHRLTRQLEFQLHVVHVHHGLRDSAQGDLEFVEELCRRMEVPCTIVRVDAAAKAKEWGTGVEEAGRRLRYDAFEQVCSQLAGEKGAQGCSQLAGEKDVQICDQFAREKDAQVCSQAARQKEERGKPEAFRIAVAHHREDQAETVLFHLCRGTDLRGARGMLPVNGKIIRPLLCECRASIEEYLTQKGFSWQEDETNEDVSYTRNYLRREILPRLENGVHAAAAQRISQFASVCAEAEDYLTGVTDRAMERCLLQGAPMDTILVPPGFECLYTVNIDTLLQEDPYLQGRILYRCLTDSTDSGKDIGNVHVDALRGLCAKKTDGQLSMPEKVIVFRTAGRLLFCREKGLCTRSDRDEMYKKQERRSYPLSEKEYECCVLNFDGSMSSIPRNEYTKWFDYDKIGTFPVFRTRQPGDCMRLFSDAEKQNRSGLKPSLPPEDCGPSSEENRNIISKKLARIMLDGKIPAGIRDRIVLPFAGKEALWIPGLRMGDSCKVTSATTRILEIRWNSVRIFS